MERKSKLQIGIIGAGIAGSSAAYFLHKALRDQVDIVVYEKEARIGGRIRRLKIGDEKLEAGGSIIHSENQYLSNIVDELGLEKSKHVYDNIGIWNGDAFTLRTGKGNVQTITRMLIRYGMSPIKIQPIVSDMIKKLSNIYTLQKKGIAFSNPKDLFNELGLYPLSQMASKDYFRQKGISDKFINEFINGISRLNYGQDTTIHGLVNLVSLAGASFGGYLFAVKDGNAQICQRMLQTSSAKILNHSRVSKISKQNDPGQQNNSYIIATEDGKSDQFDGVIIATPLEKANIKLENIKLDDANKLARPYQVTHVTYVLGRLNPSYFNMKESDQLPTNILTQEKEDIPFSSIELTKRDTETGQSLYRIFSRQKLSETILEQVFLERKETETTVWDAYPVLTPTEKWPSFILEKDMYYINAMESAVSTMETEVIGSKNVVNLLLKRLNGTQD